MQDASPIYQEVIMNQQLRRHYWHLALLLLALAVTASAQEFRGALTGKITDQAGAAVPGATVSIKNVETNIVNTTTTNADGSYNFPLLQPGKYALSVTQQGFKSVQRNNLELRVADKLTLDVQLEVGAAIESVTVVGSAPTLETGSVTTGTVISSQEIN